MAISREAWGQVAVLGLSICTLAGCGVVPSTAAQPSASASSETCQHRSKDPQVGTDLLVVTAVGATASDVDSWLRVRAADGGPSISLESYPQLKVVNPEAAMTVCLFQGPPRPIPHPKPGVEVPADGISVITDAAGDYQIDGIGPIGALRAEVSTLRAKE